MWKKDIETQDRRMNRTKGTSRGNNSQSARGCRWSNIGWQILDQSKRNWKRFGIKPTATQQTSNTQGQNTQQQQQNHRSPLFVCSHRRQFFTGGWLVSHNTRPPLLPVPVEKRSNFSLLLKSRKRWRRAPTVFVGIGVAHCCQRGAHATAEADGWERFFFSIICPWPSNQAWTGQRINNWSVESSALSECLFSLPTVLVFRG